MTRLDGLRQRLLKLEVLTAAVGWESCAVGLETEALPSLTECLSNDMQTECLLDHCVRITKFVELIRMLCQGFNRIIRVPAKDSIMLSSKPGQYLWVLVYLVEKPTSTYGISRLFLFGLDSTYKLCAVVS